MTREEIMQLNTDYLNGCESEHKMNELFSYVLEQQSITTTNNDEPITVIYPTIVCDDAISRQAVFDNSWELEYPDGTSERVVSVKDIEQLPPVTQKSGKWIPVSERLPEEYGNYLTTVESSDGTATITYQYVDHYGSEWLHEDKTHKVTAWMPLPEPYKAESEEV